MLLQNIHSPADVKKLSKKELPVLAKEIRKTILETVGKQGGHLASNLGVVELTIALHRVFNSPQDAIIWDVSHQSYTHKLLTGRYEQFYTLRQEKGISGFTRSSESEHDYFDSGHASTAISSAIGLLSGWHLTGHEGKVVAVIGDGALTGGEAYEALNHAGQLSRNLIVILNDNRMSISRNTGAVSRYLSRLTMGMPYQKFRYKFDRAVDRIPYFNRHLAKFIFRFKRSLKGLLLTNNLFVDLGFEYVGPLDGHNIEELEMVLRKIKQLPRPVVVHVITKKGQGYSPAENDPSTFHGVGPFNITDGVMEKCDRVSFTKEFSNDLIELAEKNEKIVAITAAMAKGTGLDPFGRRFPQRFFDVGIAEEHAVTFAGGLARSGLRPVVAIYSTFLQRAIDQIIHDVAISKLPVVFCIDRAGPVPGDGETHQGLFDIALLQPVPGLDILCPAGAADLKLCLEWALNENHPVAIRYPKSNCPTDLAGFSAPVASGRGLFISAEELSEGLFTRFQEAVDSGEKEYCGKVLLVCTGSMFSEVQQASRSLLMQSVVADVYSLRFIKPFDSDYFLQIAAGYEAVVVVEDTVHTGSFSRELALMLTEAGKKFSCLTFPDHFMSQGTREQLCKAAGVSPEAISRSALELLSQGKAGN